MKAGLPLKLGQVAHYIVQLNFQYLKGCRLPAFLVISSVTWNVFPSIQLQFTMLSLVTVYFYSFCSASSHSLRQKSAIPVSMAGKHSRLQRVLEISDCAGDTFSIDVEQAK